MKSKFVAFTAAALLLIGGVAFSLSNGQDQTKEDCQMESCQPQDCCTSSGTCK